MSSEYGVGFFFFFVILSFLQDLKGCTASISSGLLLEDFDWQDD